MEQEPNKTAETEAPLTAQPATQPTGEKSNTASRVITSAFFAKLFAGVLNNPGQIMDVNNALASQNKSMTFTEKVGSLFTTGFWKKLWAQHQKIIEKEFPNNPVKGFFVATNRVLKYTIIFSAVGGTIGAVLGWSLGDRIKDSKDLYKHPWQSTKILLGITKPDAEQTPPTMLAENKKPAQEATTTKWQDYAKERQADSAVMGKAV